MTFGEHTYHWHWTLRSSPSQVWPLVSDTQLFNRLALLPPMTLTDGVGPDGKRRRFGSFNVFGLGFTWIEAPFQWLEGQEYEIERIHLRGPITVMRVQMRLTPEGSGTRVDVRITTVPRSSLGFVLVPLLYGFFGHRAYRVALERIDAYLQGERPLPPAETAPLAPAARARLDNARRTLSEVDPGLVERLCSYLEHAPDDDVSAMRPYALADLWGIDRLRLLELFLTATRAGLLELRWELLCPLCRASVEHFPHLSQLHQGVHCAACLISFDVDFDRSVELRFSVHPSIREAQTKTWCSGGPRHTPHIVAQTQLQAGERRTLRLSLKAGSYRVRGLDAERVAWIDVAEGGRAAKDATPVELTLSDAGFTPGRAVLTEGAQALSLLNITAQLQPVALEHTDWAAGAVTAAEVTTLQHYRDLFSSEVLRPGEQFSIRSLTFLFTDLRQSSQLYLALGDSAAFRRVREHFRLLIASIRAARGAVVKTVGDAVMAVFQDPADAVRAVLDIQERLAAFNDGSPPREQLVLRAGLHSGPCIAVNANDLLDYFGVSVNFAARIQGFGQGGDIVVTPAILNDPGVQSMLEVLSLQIDSFRTPVKGFEGEYEMFRLRPALPAHAIRGTALPA